jgi:protein tyrosine/serine phosphatase
MHCYGGQHRTGIIFGIIQKCLNRIPIDEVIAEYRCHTAYESPEHPGGAKPENERAIREFPCKIL